MAAVGAMPPLGLAWLAATLEKAGIGVEILDRQADRRSFSDVFQTARPKILGISTTTSARFQAFRYAAEAKRLAPQTVVVFGGSHATCAANDTLTHLPQVDAVALGEGEATMLEVARRVLDGGDDFAGILGLTHRRGAEIVAEPPRPRERNLDSLGFPARHLLPNALYGLENEFIGGAAFHVMASRGCPFLCTFCSAAKVWGHHITFRTPRHVVDEMEQLRDEFGARGYRFMDALVTLRRDYIAALCREIIDRGIRLPWECEVRVDTIDEEILKLMLGAGCYYLDFGAESASDRVLSRMKKKITRAQIASALTLTHRLGFKTKVFFTFGHIGETLADARDTLRFIREHSRAISRIGGSIGINIFPGTEVEEFARSIGCLSPDFSWSMPFHEPRNSFFSTPPSVPILIQPGFGWKEMYAVRYQQLLQKARDPRLVFSYLGHLANPNVLRRAGRLLTGAIRGRISRGRRTPAPR
jgi:anaerobic magnesium-protoporphyrin IX monomethyl ester cyclase